MIKLQEGDVGFAVFKSNWISNFLHWLTGYYWSHCFIVCEVTESRVFVIERSGFKISYGIFSKYWNQPSCKLEIFRPEMEGYPKQTVVSEVESHVGTCHKMFNHKLVSAWPWRLIYKKDPK